MRSIIKEWTYRDYYDKEKKIEYCSDAIYLQSFYFDDVIKKSVEDFLIYPYPLATSRIDCEVAQYVALNHIFDEQNLSKELSMILKFWRNIDLDKLPNLILFPTPKYSHQTFLEFNSQGVRIGYMNQRTQSKEYQYGGSDRLHNLFFTGPSIAGLRLDDRILLRQTLFSAIDSKSELKINDAFPIFDYSKLPQKKWEYSHDNNFSGEFVELHEDRFVIGGWSNPRDGGSRDESIELVWSKRPNFVDNNFGANKELEKILTNALIKEAE